MNESSENPKLTPELEARFVALVLGEASDFEREQLEALAERDDELGALYDELKRVHGLMESVAEKGRDTAGEDDWKLSPDRRKEVLSVIGGDDTAQSQAGRDVSSNERPVSRSRTGAGLRRYRRLALGFGVAGCLAGSAFWIQLGLDRRYRMQLTGGTVASLAIPEQSATAEGVSTVELTADNDFDAPQELSLALKSAWDDSLERSTSNQAKSPELFGAYSGGEGFASGTATWQATQVPAEGIASGLGVPSTELRTVYGDFADDVTAPEGGTIMLGGIKRSQATRQPTSDLLAMNASPQLNNRPAEFFQSEERYAELPPNMSRSYRFQDSKQGQQAWAMPDGEKQVERVLERLSRSEEIGAANGRGGVAGGLGGESGKSKAARGEPSARGMFKTHASPSVPDYSAPTEAAPSSESAVPSDKTSNGVILADDIVNLPIELPQSVDLYAAEDGVASGAVPSPQSAPEREEAESLGRQAGQASGSADRQMYFGSKDRAISELETAGLVDAYNGLMEDERYREAEVIANQLSGGEHNSEISSIMLHNAQNRQRIANSKDATKSKEDAFFDTLNDVDRSSIAISEREKTPSDWRELAEVEMHRIPPDQNSRNQRVRDSSLSGKLKELEGEAVVDALGEIRGQLGYLGSEAKDNRDYGVFSSRESLSKGLDSGVESNIALYGSGELTRTGPEATSLSRHDSAWFGYAPPAKGLKKRRSVELEVAPSISEKSAAEDPFSTFSLHVSDVSFKLAAAALAKGEWPKREQVRIEEFVAAFDYGDPTPTQSQRVGCTIEQCIHPFQQQRNVLRIAMRTAAAGRASQTPLRLTLLLDNSGSMERYDRQQTVERAFELLASQLQPNDQVTLISFASQPRLLADGVSGSQAGSLTQIVNDLPSEGGTNIEAALQLATEKAREQFDAAAQNRIVLLTDGAVNLGDADPEGLAESVEALRQSGIAFDAAGIIADGLNDEVLEALTRNGDGRYYLLDSVESADGSFARQIAGALRPSAKNVKVQVEFNPDRVGNYKLLGFEKHVLKKEDFRNDAVDAAEMAAAEAGVAVYQFEAKQDGQGDVGFVSVRFQDLSTGQMVERRWPIPYDAQAPRPEQSSASMQIATAAAMLAAKLRGDPLGESVDLAELASLIASLPPEKKAGRNVAQLQNMIQQARELVDK
ncbi:MAG: hypothetical protein Aurels2KO_47910 [Aureliella sp.]